MDSIDSLSSSQSFSSTSKQNVNNNYKLAVKSFMNKNFSKSFDIISKLFEKSFQQFSSGVIPEQLFVKIVNLYIIQVGLLLDDNRKDFQIKLPESERDARVRQLRDDEILNQSRDIYGSVQDVPTEIIYNLLVTTFINRQALAVSDETCLSKFEDAIFNLEGVATGDKNSDSHHTEKKLVDFYVFDVLTTFHKYQEAKSFIQVNPYFADSRDESLQNLHEIIEEKTKSEESDKKKKQELLNKKKESERAERQRLEEQKKEENLNYRTLKQIKNQAAASANVGNGATSSSNAPIKSSASGRDLVQIKQKLMYQLNLSKKYLVDNYPVVVVVILSLLLGTRFIRSRKINVKEKLVETIKMALKVSYL